MSKENKGGLIKKGTVEWMRIVISTILWGDEDGRDNANAELLRLELEREKNSPTSSTTSQ